jgi:hypothetical protein
MNIAFIEEELGKSTWFAGEEVTGAGMFRHGFSDVRCYDELSRTTFYDPRRWSGTGNAKIESFYKENGRATCISESSGEGWAARTYLADYGSNEIIFAGHTNVQLLNSVEFKYSISVLAASALPHAMILWCFQLYTNFKTFFPPTCNRANVKANDAMTFVAPVHTINPK